MTTQDNGGPAFPIPLQPEQVWQGMNQCDGMTLRDYFAAKAMHASLSLDPANAASSEDHARWAYELADAMLRARGVQ